MNRDSTPGRATRGAVYVEFLIAFMPFFVFFLCLWQLSIAFYTKLFVDHAAISAARAAAVIVAESADRVNDPGGDSTVNKLTSERKLFVRAAVDMALAPLIIDGTIGSISVIYPEPTKPLGPDAMLNKTYPGMTRDSVSMMRVRVRVMMMCRIALVNAIVCPGLFGQLGVGVLAIMPKLPVSSEAIFPFQGASYVYDPNDANGNNTATKGGGGGNTGASSLFASTGGGGLPNGGLPGGGGAPGGFCFAAGTLVDTADGLRPIERVHEGDLVRSRGEGQSDVTLERVARTFVTPEQSLVEVHLREGQAIRATPGHLFWTADRGWVEANDLEPGELLVGERSGEVHVTSVDPLAEPATVYNFEVERTHTYFVGDTSVWVHNPTGKGNGSNPCAAGGGGGGGSGSNGGGTGGGGSGASSGSKSWQSGGVSRPTVTDPALNNLMDAAYKRGATVGNGSTADAVRFELATGEPVRGKFHSIKANELINAMNNWARRNPNASAEDKAAANAVKQDLINALAGR